MQVFAQPRGIKFRTKRATRVLTRIAWSTGFLIVSGACAPQVSSLKVAPPAPRWLSTPFPASVTVESLRIRDDGYLDGDEQKLSALFSEQGLAQVLLDHRVFARTYPGNGTAASTDLVLRGDVVAHWDPHGAANFFTWWPGGLVLAPNWYGTRMEFFANASIDLIDVRTGERRATYQASTAHQVIHRSGSPGPFFGAAIIVPNVVKGARLSRPREPYPGVVFPVANSQLWEEIAAQIVEDQSGVYASEARAQRERCGSQLDLPPRIGQRWSEFVSCQSNYYELDAEVQLAEGSAAVFVQTESGSRISVVGDEIVRWEKPRTGPARGSPRE